MNESKKGDKKKTIYKQNTNETNETQTFKDIQTKYETNETQTLKDIQTKYKRNKRNTNIQRYTNKIQTKQTKHKH